MADRLSQSPMVPPQSNPGMLQQQQQQHVASLNREHGRAWQQMQNSYPAQSNTDMHNAQINQQIAELLRAQRLAHPLLISQPHRNQQIGLSQQQMGISPQQPPFHDPAGRRPMTFQEFRERAKLLQQGIVQRENMMAQLSNQRTGISDGDYVHQMQTWTAEIKGHKELLTKVLMAMGQAAYQQSMLNPSLFPQTSMANLDAATRQQQQQQQQSVSVHVGQSQPQWTLPNGSSQQSQSQQPGLGNAQMGQAASLSQAPSLNIQPSPLQLHSRPNHLHTQGVISPRAGSMAQLLSSQIQTLPAPNVSHQYPYQVRQLQAQLMTLPPPLGKTQFATVYKIWCTSKGLHHDARIMSIEARPIDLYALHTHVMREGGYHKVSREELWAVIGARMGFVQFPGSDTEQAKPGPGAAQRLAHVYKEYLFAFDNLYIGSVLERRRRLQPPAGLQTTARTIPNAQEMQAAIMHAYTPTQDLRTKNLPDHVIAFIERNRQQKQESAKIQDTWRGLLKSAPGQPGPSLDRQGPPNNSASLPSQQSPNIPHAMQHTSAPRAGPFMQQQTMSPSAGNHGEMQFSRQPQAPPMSSVSQGLMARLSRSNPEQWHANEMFILRIKQEFLSHTIPALTAKSVADDQKLDFNRVLDQLQRLATEIDYKLPLFRMLVKQEDQVRRVVAIILTVYRQRHLLSSLTPTPKYIVDFSTLSAMVTQMQHANDALANHMALFMKQQASKATAANTAQPGSSNVQLQRPPIPQTSLPLTVPQFIPPTTNSPTPVTSVSACKKMAIAPLSSQSIAYSDRTELLSPAIVAETHSYGATFPRSSTVPSSRRIMLNAAIKMAPVFIVCILALGGTLWLALPTLEEADRPLLKIPKSFAELQTLNVLIKKYRDIYPYRIIVCYVTTYLFLQAFSLPGSMYLSILGGTVWGVPRALPLVCACVASGATLCYLISATLGPTLLTTPKWKNCLDKWAEKIQAQKDNLISFLIVLRIAPLPPHWVINVVCPHIGIGIIPFWVSTFLGILGVSVIHTTIGSCLDEMTSADDFHLFSWRNILGLSAVVVGVLILVGLGYYFKRELASVADVEQREPLQDGNEKDQVLAAEPQPKAKSKHYTLNEVISAVVRTQDKIR